MTDQACGLTVDGIPIPRAIEAAGGEAIESYVLEQLTAPAPSTDAVDGAQTPPTDAEGEE